MPPSTTESYGTAWRRVLEVNLEACLSYFFPQAWAALDWDKGYEFLDRELHETVPPLAGSEQTRLDVLWRSWEKQSGSEVWVTLHIERQRQPTGEFGRRLLRYNGRLMDRYDQNVASLAILGDEHPEWQERSYVVGAAPQSQLMIRYPLVKLLDYADNIEALDQDANPFALIVKAHLAMLETSDSAGTRHSMAQQMIQALRQQPISHAALETYSSLIHAIMA
jgi:hypothetical protein